MARKKRPSERKPSSVLAQLEASGLTQREFAEREGVPLSTLTYWLRRERLERKEKQGQSSLVQVASVPEPAISAFIITRGDLRIEVPRDVTAEEWERLRRVWAS